MTRDFRHLNEGRNPGASRRDVDKGRQIVLASLYATSIAFFLGGLWLLSGEQSIFASEIASILGYSFIFVAITDVILVQVLKRMWRRGGNVA